MSKHDHEELIDGLAEKLSALIAAGPFDDGSTRVLIHNARNGPELLNARDAGTRDVAINILRDGDRVKVVIDMEVESPEISP